MNFIGALLANSVREVSDATTVNQDFVLEVSFERKKLSIETLMEGL